MSQRTESDKPALPQDHPQQLPLPEPPEPVLIVRWRCLNCGQQTFAMPDEAPPEICAYCRDMTTWHRVKP